MNKECYDTGSCIECGCTTTALQCANKACEGECYPNMMPQWKWENLKSGHQQLDNKTGIMWILKSSRFMKIGKIGTDIFDMEVNYKVIKNKKK